MTLEDMEHVETHRHRGTRCFRIWVQGRLDEGFVEGLSGIEQTDVPAGTMLSGALLDQSQVHGLLDLLRGLGIDVLRFEIDPPPPVRYEAPSPSATGQDDPAGTTRVTTQKEAR